ncbi:MAG: ACP S-malonyltransferase [Thermoanaerobacteraceae bacterium]|nr:ACP S-malonyltransferase [Thermoanaerobacteraceae bacterium]
MKLAVVFPGQGAQYAGMGKDLAENFSEAMKVFDTANEALGYDIKKLCFEGPEEELVKTEITQPAILTMSLAAYKVLESKGIRPDVTAGLSLGEYCSLVISGALDFQDAVKLVAKRGRYMQETVPQGSGGMAAVMGLDREAVEEACREASDEGVVEPANINCPGQIVISGELKAIEKASILAKEKGAKRVVNLSVSAPFHCSLLQPAGDKLSADLEEIEFRHLNIPVISNVTGEYIRDESEIRNLLIRQVSSPVFWEDSVRLMLKDGVNMFIEVGPGKSLSGFIKKIDKNVDILNVEDMDSLNNTLKVLNL